MCQVEVGLEHGDPGVFVKFAFLTVFDSAVAEIGAEGGLHVFGLGTTATGAVVHVDADAAVVHQGGDGVVLPIDAVGHLVPLIGRLAEVRRLYAIGAVVVTVRAETLCGMVPIFHYLGHGTGHAAGIGVTARTSVIPPSAATRIRAEGVVEAILVPVGLHQGIDCLDSFGSELTARGRLPLHLDGRLRCDMVFRSVVDHVFIMPDPSGHVLWRIVQRREGCLLGVA